MNIRTGLAILALTYGVGADAQLAIEDVVLAPLFSLEDKELVLNGGGLRKKFFLNIYVSGLYLSNISSDARSIVNADEPMTIQMHIISDLVTSGQMISSIEQGFDKSTKGNSEQFEQEIEMLTSSFSDKFRKGDIYDIVYTPESGVQVYKNGVKSVTVGDLEFKKALWGIWLSDDPVDRKLKVGLLGL